MDALPTAVPPVDHPLATTSATLIDPKTPSTSSAKLAFQHFPIQSVSPESVQSLSETVEGLTASMKALTVSTEEHFAATQHIQQDLLRRLDTIQQKLETALQVTNQTFGDLRVSDVSNTHNCSCAASVRTEITVLRDLVVSLSARLESVIDTTQNQHTPSATAPSVITSAPFAFMVWLFQHSVVLRLVRWLGNS
ncbi:hypothetical protein ARMGADRAFT_314034 [Armillaria gallica]|uniref:Uncharacterized protein n=1 Tax=Armillaria gallica TaxID=47427 RepID=A0A2H3DFY5_ARMGA|nr:hypothetical protein ARMGADRAFT_314034 [Armillaria gallica]